MFYLFLIITLISSIIYSVVSFFPSNRSTYDRREQNVELFKAEKKNLELSTNLSQEAINLLVNEREQILLQDVPKEKELVVLTQKKVVLKPLFISVITFLAISGIYFQPLSLGSLNDLSIYNFISADLKTRDTERESVIQELNSFVNKTETTAEEIYDLSYQFVNINEFLISSLLLKDLIRKFPDHHIALTLEGFKYFQVEETDLALNSWEKAKENAKDEEDKAHIQELINTIKSMKNQ